MLEYKFFIPLFVFLQIMICYVFDFLFFYFKLPSLEGNKLLV